MILITADANPVGVIITLLSIIGAFLFFREVFHPRNRPGSGDSGGKSHYGSTRGRDHYER